MRKQKIKRMDGGNRPAKIPRVGVILWNGETGEFNVEADDAYRKEVNAVAGAVLTMDRVNLMAVPRVDVYPMYGNSRALRVVMTVVSVNLGETVVHDPEALKPWLEALGTQVEHMGLHKEAPKSVPTPEDIDRVNRVMDLAEERQRRTPDDRGNVPPWNPK